MLVAAGVIILVIQDQELVGLVVVLITVAAVVQAVTCTLLKPIYLSILGQ